MNELLSSQLYVFLIYCFSGVLIGIFFDIFRILRKSFKTADFVTYIEDIFFWIFTGVFLIYIIFKFNNGEIRSYIFIGIGVGISIYLLIFSRFFIKISLFILNILKLIFKKIYLYVLFPMFKLLKKFFLIIYNAITILMSKINKLTNILIIYVKKSKKSTKFKKNVK